MILLLTGSTETARGLVVTKILDAHDDWRLLALEDLHEDNESWDETVSQGEIFGTMIACACARESCAEGYSVVISCPNVGLVETVREALPDEKIISVHMDTEPGELDQFDYVIEGRKKSVNDTCRILEDIIAA